MKIPIYYEDLIRVRFTFFFLILQIRLLQLFLLKFIEGLYCIYLSICSHAKTHPKPITVSYHSNTDRGSFTLKNTIAITAPHIYIKFPKIPNKNLKK